MKRNSVAGLVILAVVIIAGAVYWFSIHTGDIEISIVFDRVDGISAGSSLVLIH